MDKAKAFMLCICFGVAVLVVWPIVGDWWASRGLVKFSELPKECQDFVVYGMSEKEFEAGLTLTIETRE